MAWEEKLAWGRSGREGDLRREMELRGEAGWRKEPPDLSEVAA